MCLKCDFSFSTNKTDSGKYLKVMLRATAVEHYTIGRNCLGVKNPCSPGWIVISQL